MEWRAAQGPAQQGRSCVGSTGQEGPGSLCPLLLSVEPRSLLRPLVDPYLFVVVIELTHDVKLVSGVQQDDLTTVCDAVLKCEAAICHRKTLLKRN